MSDAWDDEDFVPQLDILPTKHVASDRWEGEDEEEIVKDNWEDEDEDVESNAQTTDQSGSTAYQRPKKKPLAERIADKKAKQQMDEEEKEMNEKEKQKELTAEERLAEKVRIQKIQERDSLSIAKGLFGVQDDSLDSMNPNTPQEFSQFREALKTKITSLEESPLYSGFLSKLIQSMAVSLAVDDVKKLGVSINAIYHEKERQKKEADKKKKKKSKATIKVDKADDFDLIGDARDGGGFYDDDDDFI